MQKNLETLKKAEKKGAQESQHDGLRDEDLRDCIEDIGAEEEAIEQDNRQPFQKCAESREGSDKDGFFRIDLSRDDHGEIKDGDIQKSIEAENRTGQTIQKKTEHKRKEASPERVEMESGIDYNNQGDFHADPSQSKDIQDRDLDDHQQKQQ
jgi:hypothetical protein